MTTGKTISLTIQTFVGKVVSLLFNTLFRFVIAFLPVFTQVFLGFRCGSAGKESACNVGNLGSIPGLGRSPGEGKGYPLQYSCLKSSLDCIVHGVTKSQTPLSDFHFSSREQVSFDFMAAVTSTLILEPRKEKLPLFSLFPHLFAMSDGTGCRDLSCLNAEL